jgi:hypothetical protein
MADDALENAGKESVKSWKSIGDLIKTEITSSTKGLLDVVLEVDNAARDLSKKFGLGDELIQSMKVGLTDATQQVARLGGSFSDISKMQTEVAGVLGRNVILSSDLYSKLYAASEVTGKSGKEIVEAFRNVGTSSFQAVEGMKEVVNVARSQGVNAQAVSGEVLKNMDQMNKFTFQGGVEGLAKMASQAVGLRVNMESTLKVAEDLLQPEKAIEMAASLQRLGVAQTDLLDPLRLMDLAQNDPAELQNQIVKMTQQFVQLNEKGQFEIMPQAKRQLMEISKEMGISYNELTKMAIGSSDLDKKMREIDFSGLKITEDQQKMIANMAEMGERGVYEVQVFDKDKGEMVKKAVSELRDEDVEYLKKAGEPKTLEDLTLQQLNVSESILAAIKDVFAPLKYGLATSKPAGTLVEAGKGLVRTGSDILTPESVTPKSVREITDKSLSEITKSLTELMSGKGSLESFIDAIGKVEKGLVNFGDNAGIEIFKSIDKNIAEAAKSSDMFGILINYFKQTLNNEFKGSQTTGPMMEKNVKDAIIINTLPEDTVREVNGLAIGTNLGGGLPTEQKIMGSVDVNLNISLNSNNSNVSSNDIIEAMRNGGVQQQIITSITDAINNGMKGNVNPQLNPYSANPLLSV